MHKRSWKFLKFAAVAMVLGVPTVYAQSPGSWTMKAPIPTPRNEVALAAVGSKIHVIGGGVQGVAGTYHDEYDPATDRWRTRAPLPHGLDHIGAAVLNGKIYTVGGFVGSPHKDGQPHVLEYDPAADSWRVLSPLKVGLGSVGVTALDGKIHAVGGRTPAGRYRHDAPGLRSGDQRLERACPAAQGARSHGASRRGWKDSCDRRTFRREQ